MTAFHSVKHFLTRRWRLLLIIAIAVLGGSYLFLGGEEVSGATFTVARGDFTKQVSVSGVVTPARTVDLGFASSGRIARTYVTVGQHVGAGTVLAETENADLAADIAQKRAALEQQEAELASLKAGTRAEELAAAEADVENAQEALMNSVREAYTTADDAIHNKADSMFTNPRIQPKLTFTVSNSMLKSQVETERASVENVLNAWAADIAALTTGNVSEKAKAAQQNLAQASKLLSDLNAALNQALTDQTTTAATLSTYTTTLTTARANVNTAAAAVTADTSDLVAKQKDLTLLRAGSTPQKIAAQQAAVAAAEANLANAQAAFAKTRVVAPFSGTVTRMNAKAGAIVSPSASEISMQSDGIFQIEAYIPEVTIANVVSGNSATTTLDAYGSGLMFPAKVIAVDPAETVKDGVPTYKTTLAFLSSDDRIRSGMTVSVLIETGMLKGAIVIPSGAIEVESSGRYVSLVRGEETVRQKVEVGVSPSLGQTEILSGLSEGDVILLTPVP